jgi:hypothetical protein
VIGAVLHLWQRAVDRLGDALEGPEMASLRVTLAALSARVAAAEGEAARLLGELANAHRACGHALTVEAAATAEAVMGRGAAQAEAENLRCECDELRAEVERLRADAEATAAQSIAEWGRLKGRVNEAMDACDQMAKERDEARADVATVVDDCTEALKLLAAVRKERDEALQWRGVAASVEREVAEDRARLEEAIRERDDLRRLVRAFKVAEDAYFEAEGNVAILGADNAMCIAKADLFAALLAEGAGDG